MRTLIAILFMLLQSLAFGSTWICTYDTAGRLVNVNYGGNTNSAFSYDNNGNLLSLSSFVSANPDLAIATSATPRPVVVSKPLQYTVTVFNNSFAPASTVKLTNTLPANVTLLSNSVTQGGVAQNGNVLTWTVGTLPGAASAVLNIAVRPTSTGVLTNTAVVIFSTTDPFTADNTNVFLTSVVGPPTAIAQFSQGNFFVSWLIAGGDNFSVQYADSISAPVTWTPFPIDPTVDGDAFFIQDSVTNSRRFYRLVSP
jgi:uncharacterized repeat protein (TIGR01451 family)